MASEGYQIPSSASIHLTDGHLNESCENAKVTIMRDINGKEEDSLANTAYAYLYTEGGCKAATKIAKASLNIVMFRQWNEEYSRRFGGTPDKTRKKVCKSIYTGLKSDKSAKSRKVSIGNIFTNDDALNLMRLYPQADSFSEAIELLFTEVDAIAHGSELKPCPSSPGGKVTATKYFDLIQQENIPDLGCTTLVEPFARAAAFSFCYLHRFKRIYCGEKDYGFVNYMDVLEKWCDELFKSIESQFKSFSEAEAQGDGIEVFNKLKAKSRDVNTSSRKKKRVEAAAALYIVLGCSFCGNEAGISKDSMDKFIDKFNRHKHDLKYTSANMPLIEYVHSDFRKTIEKFKDDPTVLLILDPPYLREFGLKCDDYQDAFDCTDMLDMFELLKEAKCKVILFHSCNFWVDSNAVAYGMRREEYYVSGNTGRNRTPYLTEVYSLNIDPSIKFFDPKEHGKLYKGGDRYAE